ncbi:hypothetical protein ACOMHN_034255 [Nucella lapillus]
MTLLTILLLPAVLASLVGGQGTVQHRSGQKQAAGMEGAGLLYETENRSPIQCAVLCMGTPRCTAVTVTSTPASTSSMCRGHASVTSTSSSASASASTVVWSLSHTVWLEKNCSSDAECGEYDRECFASSCLCAPGYYFSHSLNSCVKDCAKADLHSRLLMYANRAIAGYNMGGSKNVLSQEDCRASFIQNADARTLDIVSKGGNNYDCFLQAVTKLDVSASKWYISGKVTHYQKTCA